MARECFLVVDCGTSSCRASLVTLAGEVLAESREPVQILSRQPGFAEVDPEGIWAAVARRIREVVGQAGPVDILALGVSAMVAYVFLGPDSRPVLNSLIWMDTRSVAQVRELLNVFSEEQLYLKTGRRISPEFPALKLRWLAEQQPEAYRQIRRLTSLKDEIVRRFTGTVQWDPAHFNYSFLGNVRTGKPDADIMAALGLRADLLPELRAPTQIAGTVRAEAARATGLKAGLPVIVGASDGTSAIHGAGILDPGGSVLVSGTTDTFLMLSPTFPEDPACVVTVNNALTPGEFLAGGAMSMSGGTLQAVAALLGVRFEECEEEVRALPCGSEGLLAFPGMTGERSPFWRDRLRGAFLGLTLRHGRAHLLRSVLEAAAYRLGVLLRQLGTCGLAPAFITVVGGCSGIEVWNQIRADVTGVPLLSLQEAEATTLGTAVFCRVAVDPATTLAAAARDWRRERERYLPDPERVGKYQALVTRFQLGIRALDGLSASPAGGYDRKASM